MVFFKLLCHLLCFLSFYLVVFQVFFVLYSAVWDCVCHVIYVLYVVQACDVPGFLLLFKIPTIAYFVSMCALIFLGMCQCGYSHSRVSCVCMFCPRTMAISVYRFGFHYWARFLYGKTVKRLISCSGAASARPPGQYCCTGAAVDAGPPPAAVGGLARARAADSLRVYLDLSDCCSCVLKVFTCWFLNWRDGSELARFHVLILELERRF